MSRELIIKTIMDTKQADGKLDTLSKKGASLGGAFSAVGGIATKFGALAISVGAVAGAIGLAKSAFSAWVEETESISTLNSALQATGQYTTDASTALQDFASALQEQTTIGNEAILQYESQAILMTSLATENIPVLVEAVLGLSKTFDVDYKTALKQVTPFLEGTTDKISRLGIEVDANATKQERLSALSAKGAVGFSALKDEANTLTGAQKQLGNAWGDFLEVLVGATGVTMPSLGAATKGITDVINIFGSAVTKNADDSGDHVTVMGKVFAQIFAGLGKGIIFTVGFIGTAINGLKMTFTALGIGVIEVVQAIIAGIDNLAKGFAAVVNGMISSWNVLAKAMGWNPIKRISEEGIPFLHTFYDYLQGLEDQLVINLGGLVEGQELFIDTLYDAWDSINDTSVAIKENSAHRTTNTTATKENTTATKDGATASNNFSTEQTNLGSATRKTNSAIKDQTDAIKDNNDAMKDFSDAFVSYTDTISAAIKAANEAEEARKAADLALYQPFKDQEEDRRSYFEKLRGYDKYFMPTRPLPAIAQVAEECGPGG